MSQPENQERKNQAVEIEDLTVDEIRQDGVKGGFDRFQFGVEREMKESG